MRRNLPIFLSVVMVMVILFGVLKLNNIDNDTKIFSVADLESEIKDLSLREINADGGSTDEIKLVIKKTHQELIIYKGNTEVKRYKAQFGEGGMGDKEIQGDRMTPEGTFYITEKSVLDPADEYLGSRWMRLSYPNIEDAQRGLSQGIIDNETHDSIVWAIKNKETPPQRTPLGGGIGIHGGDVAEFDDNWTWGCIGLTNEAVEEIYNYVSIGTSVIITK